MNRIHWVGGVLHKAGIRTSSARVWLKPSGRWKVCCVVVSRVSEVRLRLAGIPGRAGKLTRQLPRRVRGGCR